MPHSGNRVQAACDFSRNNFFDKLATDVDNPQTLTVAFIAFFGPKR